MGDFPFVRDVTYCEAHANEFPEESLEPVSKVGNHFIDDARGTGCFIIGKCSKDSEPFIVCRRLYEIGIVLLINVVFGFVLLRPSRGHRVYGS